MIDRIKRLQNIITNEKLDIIIIFDLDNIAYLCGFKGDSGCMIVTEDECILITNSLYFEEAKHQASCSVIECTGSLFELIAQQIKKFNKQKVGFEDNILKYSEYIKLKDKLECDLIPIGSLISQLRTIKDSDELELIEKSAKLADSTFEHIIKYIKPGVSEFEITAEIEYFMKKNGAQDLAFNTIVASGARTSLPHAIPSSNKVKLGDFVLLDYGCKLDGYCSDITRTVVVGNPSKEQRKVYNTVLEAQLKALEFIGCNKKASQVDAVARDIIKQSGYGEYFKHSLGHGVGIAVHEEPIISSKSDVILKTGMVVTIEPGIYIEGLGGVRIEDMVVIEDNGVKNLMKCPKELIVL